MTIALSITDGQRLCHLGEARQFALVEVQPPGQTILRLQVIAAPPHEPGSFPRWLSEQNVQVLISAGIGQRALDNLNHSCIEARIGQPGAAARHECRLSDYLEGQLATRDLTDL